MSEIITVTITNWDSYNPRKDFKKPIWFSLNNRMVEDADFFDFNHGEFKAWIYILSRASQKPSSTITINPEHADRVSKISQKDFFSSIKKLQSLHMITVLSTDNERETSVISTDNELYKQTNTTQQTNNNAQSLRKFDFEEAYKNYPRKLGRAKAFKVLEKVIHSEQDFQDLLKAISNYAQDCRLKGTEITYIKHFSSFVGTAENQPWRDYVDFKPSSSAPLEPKKRDYSFLGGK